MKFGKLILFTVLGVLFSWFTLIRPAYAVTVIAATSTSVGETEVIALTGSPSGAYNTATIDLSFSAGFIVLDYEAPAGSWTVTNTCPGGQAFTDTRLCVDLQKNTGDIVDGEDLGLITVSIVEGGSLTVSGTTNNGYTDGGVGVETVSGTLFTMSATGGGTTPPTTLPDTAFGDNLPLLNYTSAIGLLLMGAGTGVMWWRLSSEEFVYMRQAGYESGVKKRIGKKN